MDLAKVLDELKSAGKPKLRPLHVDAFPEVLEVLEHWYQMKLGGAKVSNQVIADILTANGQTITYDHVRLWLERRRRQGTCGP